MQYILHYPFDSLNIRDSWNVSINHIRVSPHSSISGGSANFSESVSILFFCVLFSQWKIGFTMFEQRFHLSLLIGHWWCSFIYYMELLVLWTLSFSFFHFSFPTDREFFWGTFDTHIHTLIYKLLLGSFKSAPHMDTEDIFKRNYKRKCQTLPLYIYKWFIWSRHLLSFIFGILITNTYTHPRVLHRKYLYI